MQKENMEKAEIFRVTLRDLLKRATEYCPEASTMIPQHPVWTEFDELIDDKDILENCKRLKDKALSDSGLLLQFWKALPLSCSSKKQSMTFGKNNFHPLIS